MVGLRAMVGLLTADGIRGNLWIDGSFVTKKLEPDDVDVVLEISEPTEITPEQKNRLKWFALSPASRRGPEARRLLVRLLCHSIEQHMTTG